MDAKGPSQLAVLTFGTLYHVSLLNANSSLCRSSHEDIQASDFLPSGDVPHLSCLLECPTSPGFPVMLTQQ